MDYDDERERTWQKAIERLYHEDELLFQRTYNFSTVQAFLVAALAFSSLGGKQTGIGYVVAILGLVLSLLFIPLGFRNYTSIRFWRKYLEHLESKGGPKLDSAQSEFFDSGSAQIDSAVRIGLKGKRNRPSAIREMFPWVLARILHLPKLGSTSSLVGVGIPLLSTLFWVAVMFIMKVIIGVIASCLLAVLIAFALFGRLIPPEPELLKDGDTKSSVPTARGAENSQGSKTVERDM